MSNKLIPLVLTPEKGASQEIDIYTLSLPEEWIKELNRLYCKIKERGTVSIPIKSLNTAVETLFPNIIKTETKVYRPPYKWIVASKPIDLEKLKLVLMAWYKNEFLDESNQNYSVEVKSRFDIFNEKKLAWVKDSIKLGQWDIYENGTVNLVDSYYSAIPHYMCNYIVKNNIHFMVGGMELYFKSHGNELISWPPMEYKKSFFSLVIGIDVKTQPLCSRPLILISPSIRRWVTEEGTKYLSREENTSVYISCLPQWEKELNDLALARIEYDYKAKVFVWADKISEILSSFNVGSKLPSVETLLSSSQDYIKGNGKYCLAITFSNKTPIYHKVRPGVSMIEKRDIFNTFKQVFPWLLEYSQAFEISEIKRRGTKNGLLSKVDESLGEKLRSSMAKTLGREFAIEIFYSTEETKVGLVKAIEEIFGVNKDQWSGDKYITVQLDIHVACYSLGAMGDRLGAEDDYVSRIEKIKAFLPKTSKITGTIVELSKKDWDKKPKTDPKGAIRKALYLGGRVNQFITPTELMEAEGEETKEEHKFHNAVLDLLRQLGYMPSPLSFEGLKTVPKDIDVYGVWLIRKNKGLYKDRVNFPLIVKVSTRDREILVRSPIFNGWKTYREAILELGARIYKGKDNLQLKDDEIQGFISRFIKEVDEEEVIVIFDGVKMRGAIPCLSDKHITAKSFFIGDNPHKSPSNYPRLRIIRVKEGEEIPDYYGENKEEQCRFVSGVKLANPLIYYSIGNKSNTLKGVKDSKTRIGSPSADIRYPKILEIMPFFTQEGDDIGDYAYGIHLMRRMNPIYDDITRYPLPLHLAIKMEEIIG